MVQVRSHELFICAIVASRSNQFLSVVCVREGYVLSGDMAEAFGELYYRGLLRLFKNEDTTVGTWAMSTDVTVLSDSRFFVRLNHLREQKLQTRV
jgi:hypothetical protein